MLRGLKTYVRQMIPPDQRLSASGYLFAVEHYRPAKDAVESPDKPAFWATITALTQ
jgi:hypothetical protein